jgi:hypothetical protein
VTFNRANSDSKDVSWRVDWVLMCAAFQRLLGTLTKALHRAGETVAKFKKHISMPANKVGVDVTIAYDWLEEFCSLRGDFAHGKRHPTQPRKWDNETIHLLTAAITLPLLIRTLLQELSRQQVIDHRRDRVVALQPGI